MHLMLRSWLLHLTSKARFYTPTVDAILQLLKDSLPATLQTLETTNQMLMMMMIYVTCSQNYTTKERTKNTMRGCSRFCQNTSVHVCFPCDNLFDLRWATENMFFHLNPVWLSPRCMDSLKKISSYSSFSDTHISCRCFLFVANVRSWWTSHQLFQDLLSSTWATSTLTIQIFQYTLDPDQPLLSVNVLKDAVSTHVLDVNKRKKPAQKRKTLPLGVRPQPKKRRTTVKPKSDHATAPFTTRGGLLGALLKPLDEEHEGSLDDFVDSNDSASDSSSNETETGFTSESDTDTDAEEVLANPGQRREEKATDEILQSQEAFEEEKEPLHPPIPAAEASARMRPTTQCNSSIGVCDLSTQVAARLAKCKYCVEKIQRFESRIGYAFSKVKFHCYLHFACFPSYMEREKGDLSQARAFVQEWLRKPSDSSDVANKLRRDVQGLAASL